jgi:hypothetical protein
MKTIRVNITIDKETYRALRIETISMGLLRPGTCAALILRNHSRKYLYDNAEEIKNGFVSGFLEGIDKPAITHKRKKSPYALK